MPRRDAIKVIEQTYEYPRKPRRKLKARLKLRCSQKDLRRMEEAAAREHRGVEDWAIRILVTVARYRGWDLVTWSPVEKLQKWKAATKVAMPRKTKKAPTGGTKP